MEEQNKKIGNTLREVLAVSSAVVAFAVVFCKVPQGISVFGSKRIGSGLFAGIVDGVGEIRQIAASSAGYTAYKLLEPRAYRRPATKSEVELEQTMQAYNDLNSGTTTGRGL